MKYNHFLLQKDIADMLRMDNYYVLENMAYPSYKNTIGEIDVIGFKNGIELWEIKTRKKYISKAINQLLREERYFGTHCEKYIYAEDTIYYLW